MREKRKKDAARQALADDRQKRILQAAELVVKERIDKGELVKKNPAEENQQASGTLKRAGSAMQDVPEAKLAKTAAMPWEIESHNLTVSTQHLGSGSYGTCYLGKYRNMVVVVKTLHLRKLDGESDEQAENRVRKNFYMNTVSTNHAVPWRPKRKNRP